MLMVMRACVCVCVCVPNSMFAFQQLRKGCARITLHCCYTLTVGYIRL